MEAGRPSTLSEKLGVQTNLPFRRLRRTGVEFATNEREGLPIYHGDGGVVLSTILMAGGNSYLRLTEERGVYLHLGQPHFRIQILHFA